jgi:hypothetical protein
MPIWMKTVVQEAFGVLGAILLSAIVVILLSRISESQFLIRITVADFWGAVAMGFIANYAGAELLKKIIKVPAGNDRDSLKVSTQKTTPSTNSSNP